MLNKFYDILLTIDYFNPYGFKSYDMNRKLKAVINDKKVIVFGAKGMDNDWYVQMVLSDNGKFDDYKYNNHVKVGSKPTIFTILQEANKMVENWEKLSSHN